MRLLLICTVVIGWLAGPMAARPEAPRRLKYEYLPEVDAPDQKRVPIASLSTTSVLADTLIDPVTFAYVPSGQDLTKQFRLVNRFNATIYFLTHGGYSYGFDDPLFELVTQMPRALDSGGSVVLQARIGVNGTGFYSSRFHAQYAFYPYAAFPDGYLSGQVSAGVVSDDVSEMSLAGRRGLTMYQEAMAVDSTSIASSNNRGALYLVFGQSAAAEAPLRSALAAARSARYGEAGIRMNLGVARSGQRQTAQAMDYYNSAANELAAGADSSVLLPWVNYNRAWEAYVGGGSTSEATTWIDAALASQRIDDIFKAKALILRGALRVRTGESEQARADLLESVRLDPGGPVGGLAQRHLDGFDRAEVVVAVFQNPIIDRYVDLFLFSAHSLSAVGASLQVDSVTTPLVLTQKEAEVFALRHAIAVEGESRFEIQAVSLGGADTTVTRVLQVRRMTRAAGGVLAIGGAVLTVPSRALSLDTWFTGWCEQDAVLPPDDPRFGVKGAPYTLGPAHAPLALPCSLSLDLGELATSPDEWTRVHVFRAEPSAWCMLPTTIDPHAGTARTEIRELGTFMLAALREDPVLDTTELRLASMPNPVGRNGLIEYYLGEKSHVLLSLFDVSGRHMRTLVDEIQEPGPHRLDWPVVDHCGKRLDNGVYFCRGKADGRIGTIRIMVVQ